MKWLFYIIILICVLSATASEICPPLSCILVCAFVGLGIAFEHRGICKKWLNRLLGVALFAALVSIEILEGGGYQAVILGVCLGIVWALLGYRALAHENTSERVQTAVLAVLPLAYMSFSLQAVEYVVFLIAYFFVLFIYLIHVSLSSPTSGCIAVAGHPARKYARFGKHFWVDMAMIAGVALAAGSFLFLVMPRYGADSGSPVPGVAQPKGGFPDVDLDKTGKIQLDPSLLFRSNVPEIPGGYYWRIDIQNIFDGKKWHSYHSGPARKKHDNPGGEAPYRVEFVRDWTDYRLPTIDGTAGVEKLDGDRNERLRFYKEGTGVWKRSGWKRSDPLMGFRFRLGDPQESGRKSIVSAVRGLLGRDVEAGDDVEAQYSVRQIWPAGLRHGDVRERLASFAGSIVRDARTDREIAVRIRDHLKNNYRYSLERPAREGFIVEDFLFSQKYGHCEVFSTAMAVLLALEGVPARNVTGFVSSEFRDGYNNVRSAHAHSWVEAWIDGAWVRFDPTPSGAQVVEVGWLLRMNDWFSSYRTKDFYGWVKKYGASLAAWMLAFLALSALLRGVAGYVRRRMRTAAEVYAESWGRIMKHCAGRESLRPLSERALESWWSDDGGGHDELRAFARDYIEQRYSGRGRDDGGPAARFCRNSRILARARAVMRGLK